MAKRSDKPRIPKGKYATPREALTPLLVQLSQPGIRFIEPCAGDGRIGAWLEDMGHRCTFACDVEPYVVPAAMAIPAQWTTRTSPVIHTRDARKLEITDVPSGTTHAITNPPWPLPGGTGEPTLAIIRNMLRLNLTTWCLLSADFMHAAYATPLLRDHGNKIVSVGRVRWFPKSDHDGMDNACWYQFVPWLKAGEGGPTFYPKARFAHGRR